MKWNRFKWKSIWWPPVKPFTQIFGAGESPAHVFNEDEYLFAKKLIWPKIQCAWKGKNSDPNWSIWVLKSNEMFILFPECQFLRGIAVVERYDLATEIDAINRMIGKLWNSERRVRLSEGPDCKKIGSQWINSIDSNFDGSSELVKKRTAEAAYSKHTFLLSITRAYAPSLFVCLPFANR